MLNIGLMSKKNNYIKKPSKIIELQPEVNKNSDKADKNDYI